MVRNVLGRELKFLKMFRFNWLSCEEFMSISGLKTAMEKPVMSHLFFGVIATYL